MPACCRPCLLSAHKLSRVPAPLPVAAPLFFGNIEVRTCARNMHALHSITAVACCRRLLPSCCLTLPLLDPPAAFAEPAVCCPLILRGDTAVCNPPAAAASSFLPLPAAER